MKSKTAKKIQSSGASKRPAAICGKCGSALLWVKSTGDKKRKIPKGMRWLCPKCEE